MGIPPLLNLFCVYVFLTTVLQQKILHVLNVNQIYLKTSCTGADTTRTYVLQLSLNLITQKLGPGLKIQQIYYQMIFNCKYHEYCKHQHDQ